MSSCINAVSTSGVTMTVDGNFYDVEQTAFIEEAYRHAEDFFDFHQAFEKAPFWIGEDAISALWGYLNG